MNSHKILNKYITILIFITFLNNYLFPLPPPQYCLYQTYLMKKYKTLQIVIHTTTKLERINHHQKTSMIVYEKTIE